MNPQIHLYTHAHSHTLSLSHTHTLHTLSHREREREREGGRERGKKGGKGEQGEEEEEEEEEWEEGLYKADAVNEEDSERDRAAEEKKKSRLEAANGSRRRGRRGSLCSSDCIGMTDWGEAE